MATTIKKTNTRERTAEILRILDATYPNVICALHHRNAWELLVATILSAQCTDIRVNMVTPGLFEKYPTIRDFAAARQEALAADIRSTGFFNNKSKSVIGAAKKILTNSTARFRRHSKNSSPFPARRARPPMLVLGTAFGLTSGIVVDTHVQRISNRLALTKNSDPVKIEQDLMKIIPREHWIQFSHQMIHFGRGICIARKPKCAECPLYALCWSKDKTA